LTEEAASYFNPISLEGLERVSLLKRRDTKFILSVEKLEDMLWRIRKDYEVLEVDANRLMTYRTLYFDTPEKRFYLDHHHGIASRFKVRVRAYLESDLCFLEVKRKDNKGNTDKKRIEIPAWTENLNALQKEYVTSILKSEMPLKPQLFSEFNRLTLVNKKETERLTIDLNLKYNDRSYHPNLCVVEVKQPALNTKTSVYKTLRALRVFPFSFSKYCVGMALTHKALKKNNFKTKLKQVHKL
jgi:hypothetical protein